MFPPRVPHTSQTLTLSSARSARAGAALYACQGSAAPDRHEEPNEGQVQQTACGEGAKIQAFNYSLVGCGAIFPLSDD